MTRTRYAKQKDLSASSVYSKVGQALELLQKAAPALLSDESRFHPNENIGPKKLKKQAA